MQPTNLYTNQSTTLTITDPRLQMAVISVTAASTAEIAMHTPMSGGNTWMALLIDGRYHNLIMWKHTIGRPETTEALSRVLAEVHAAIGALQMEQEIG